MVKDYIKYFIVFFYILAFSSLEGQSENIRPNILWIVCEDISPTLSMFGDSIAKTPALDALSNIGITYKNAFSTAGVCAPSRSAIITGMLQTQLGTMHMRTGDDVFSWGKRSYSKTKGITDINSDTITQYSAVIPSEVRCFTEYLRQEGYYCTNNAKTDYQFAAPLSAWDENGNNAHWRNRNAGQPFFSVFNIGVTHESRLWLNEELPLTIDPDKITVPPYLQETDTCRQMIARHYSNVELMDQEVGKILGQLKDDALFENTVIFFYSDHGGPFPRHKRELFDSGLKVPLVIKPQGAFINNLNDELISLVDLAPTVLSISGIKPPEYMNGRAFLGKYKASEKRKYILAASDRLDESTDRIRIVRDERYLYVRNYFPGKSHYEDIKYRKNIASMREMLRMKSDKLLNQKQMMWFDPKPEEELYDCYSDPFNLDNLADEPAYNDVLQEMRDYFNQSAFSKSDLGKMAEAELIEIMWPNLIQPTTNLALLEIKDNLITLKSETPGSSVSYRFSDNPDEKFDFNLDWNLYFKPIQKKKHKYIYIVAERIGYKISEQVVVKLN